VRFEKYWTTSIFSQNFKGCFLKLWTAGLIYAKVKCLSEKKYGVGPNKFGLCVDIWVNQRSFTIKVVAFRSII
jgi:hypothetical protein